MYTYIAYILLFLVVIWLTRLGDNKEGYFTFYKGMPGITKTYVSTHFIRNPNQIITDQNCTT